MLIAIIGGPAVHAIIALAMLVAIIIKASICLLLLSTQ